MNINKILKGLNSNLQESKYNERNLKKAIDDLEDLQLFKTDLELLKDFSEVVSIKVHSFKMWQRDQQLNFNINTKDLIVMIQNHIKTKTENLEKIYNEEK